MTFREISQGFAIRPSPLNLTAVGCGLLWAVTLVAAVGYLGSGSDAKSIELMAVTGTPRQVPSRAQAIVAEPVKLESTSTPFDYVSAPVLEPAVEEFEVVETEVARQPTVEILEVIEHEAPVATTPAESDAAETRDAEPVYDGPTFDGRPLRKVRTLRMLVTAYSPDARSCGKWADGVTASGYSVWTNGMALAAADTSILPFHSIITVPGYNDDQPIPVLDRGGAIKGHRLDLLFPTHEIALQWGAQRIDVDVWEYAD